MTHICRKFVAITLFCAVPALAQAQPEGKKDEPTIKDVFERLHKMDKAIDSAFMKIESALLAANKRVDNLEDQVKALREEVNNLKKLGGLPEPAFPSSEKGVLDEIRAKVNMIDQTLAKMQAATKREAKSAPPPSGRILLVNHYTDQMTFYINEKPYVLPPQSSVLIEDVPVGTFSYRVTNAIYGDRRSDPAAILVAGQTYTLSAK